MTSESAQPRKASNITRPFPFCGWGLGMRLSWVKPVSLCSTKSTVLYTHNLTVVKGNSPSLLGRYWLSHIRLADIRAVLVTQGQLHLSWLFEYVDVLGGPGTTKDHLTLRENAQPIVVGLTQQFTI